LSLRTRKTRALLAFLAVNADKPQPRERLMALLWSDRGERQARQSLNYALKLIRALPTDGSHTLLDSDGEQVTLHGAALESDVGRFQALRDDDPAAAAALFDGPFLDGLSIPDPAFEEWLTATRSALEADACDTLQNAADAAAGQGEIGQALDLARRLVALDPLREDAHRCLMRYLHESGDRVAALRQYQACADILNAELQVAPDAATRALFEEIRRDEPVPASSVPLAPDTGTQQTQIANPTSLTTTYKKRLWVFAMAFVLLVIGTGVLVSGRGLLPWFAPKTQPTEPVACASFPGKPSVAVLPFANISGDEKQEYFSDGMTEDLITDLSKISNLTVISRTSTSGYKGRKIDIRDIGKALNVRCVIQGSVRKAGERVRINAQLIDATTGGQLWAERYDGDLNDIFNLQDQVLEKIVGSLALTLSGTDRQRLAKRGTDSVAAHDLYLRGLFLESGFTREGNRKAAQFYEQALSIDPDYALPYTRIANILQLNARNGWSDNVQADLKKAVELAEKAVVLDPQNPYFHWSLGRSVARLRTPEALERGIKALKQAIELDPDYADAYAFLAVLYVGNGRAKDGLRSIETAMRLNPRYPFWYPFMRGMTHYVVEDYKSAIVDFEAAAKKSPTAHFVRFWLAAAYAQAGQMEDAEWQVDELQVMGFDGTIATIVDTGLIQDSGYLSRIKAGLRKAGIPE
jgi:TolB-like protein/DNA-binding SARP family transcriptional activator/Flp pilus assembly protein TadD